MGERLLTGPHKLGPIKIYFGHKILMKPSHDCSLLVNGWEAKWSFIREDREKC